MTQHKQNAFTLIEVLIALMIIAIALLAIVKANHTTLVSEAYLEDKTEANWLASNTLAEIQLGLLVAPFDHKTSRILNRTFYRKAVIEPTPNVNISRVFITILNSEQLKILILEGYMQNKEG